MFSFIYCNLFLTLFNGNLDKHMFLLSCIAQIPAESTACQISHHFAE